MISLFQSGAVQTTFSLYHAHQHKRLILPGLHTMLHVDAIYRVARALNQLLYCIVLLLGMHHAVLCGFGRDGNDINTLGDVQLSGLTVTQSVIIIHPVGNIAALLGLKKQFTAPDIVGTPRTRSPTPGIILP